MKDTSIFLSGLVLCLTLALNGQNVFIKGRAVVPPGNVVRLLAPVSPFLNTYDQIDVDTISSDGSFELRADIRCITRMAVDIWFHRDYFLLQPGDTLAIISDQTVSWSLGAGQSSAGFFEADIDPYKTTHIITNFEVTVAHVLDSVFDQVFRKRDLTVARRVVASFEKLAANSNDTIAQLHAFYQLVALKLDMGLMSSAEAITLILSKRPDYCNYSYMELVVKLFGQYHLKSIDLQLSGCLQKAVKGAYSSFLNCLGADSLLKNEIIRELAALVVMGDIVQQLPSADRTLPIAMFDSLSSDTKFEEHKNLASRQALVLRRLVPGFPAPPLQGRMLSDADTVNGQPLLIIFSHSRCASCNESAEWLSSFVTAQKWTGRVLTVFTDSSYSEYLDFISVKKWPWESIWVGNDIEVLELWGVRSLPLTVVVSPSGAIVHYPWYLPGPETERFLLALIEKKRPVRRPMRPANR